MNSLFALLSAATVALTAPVDGGESTQKVQEPPAQAQQSDRICRRIALDIGSRKKEEVCLTAKEWRAFNNPR